MLSIFSYAWNAIAPILLLILLLQSIGLFLS